MDIPIINLKAQFQEVKEEILKKIGEILSEQKLILGDYVKLLEKTIGEYTGVPYAISCANGTDALILSLMALGIKEGDEVITTPYTFFSTASSIALLGGRPVFVDIDERDLNINPEFIEAAITPKTKAIMVVHLFGKLCDMKPIEDIADRYGLSLIEDMAQSLGARKDGKMAGSFGDIAALSFYPTKNLGGIGEGGMVLTKREDLGEKVKKLRVHGMGQVPYIHEMLGINSRLDEIKACALTVKFPHLEAWNRKRIENALYYNERFKGLPLILPRIEGDQDHIFHLYVVRTEKREGLKEHLKQKGVQTGVYYPVPLHLQECFGYLGYKKGDLPVSEVASRTSLALPVYPELKEEEREYIAGAVIEFFT
ncbi:MAG: DegT/DnrJ/EryC1/StrS family aminotransferase [Syntrophorhabdaceae bacterium]|nr:DegT/DnrJ/EryC1/StrS family aminotransferase [Syntrophorhabdaceae bacterium]